MSESKGREGLDDRVLRAARNLPVDIRPERDLWPEIAARIAADEAPPARRFPWRLVGAVAAAVALVASSSLLTLWLSDEPPEVIVRQPATPEGMVVAARTAPREASFAGYRLGPRYERARQELTRDLEQQLDALPEDTRALVKRNLAQIRSALAEINDELAQDPNNVLLQQLLLAAYQDELAVLMNVNRMAQTLPTRNEI
jgi:hypothetical protein